MPDMSRRNYIQGTLASLVPVAGAAADAAAASTPLRKAAGPKDRGIQLAELFQLGEDHKIRLAAQIGITHAIVGVSPALSKVAASQYVEVLRKIRTDFEAAGLFFAGVESHPVPAEKIKLGLPGRDEEIENYMAAIRALAEVGVPLLCYNWMAGIGWYRTRVDLPGRGGALLSEFDNRAAEAQGLTEWGRVSEEKIWTNLEYFLKAVIPVAEKVNVKMALHPDDPPLSPLRGIGRILTSAANYRRVLKMSSSPVHGITFCQANFKLMGEDIAALAREWCEQKKIFFVHFRDVEGTREHFRETFHDNGPVDLAQMLRIYHEAGFAGPMRPDHAPTLDGEANDRPGYSMGGKVLAIGYMKGAMDALGIPYASGLRG
jgi:mannonate dehydratase